jgi:KaiC/GvpD/RAD55 family RecA-like ATPase
MNRRDIFRFLPAVLATRLMGGATQEIDSSPIRTGIGEFDNVAGGLPPGSLTVLYGQQKAGKTTLAMNVAEHVAVEERRPVLYLVQRFSAQTFFEQINCSRARVDFLDFAERKLSGEDAKRYEAARGDVLATRLEIDDSPHLSQEEVIQRIGLWSRKHPGGIVVVDHVDGSETERSADNWSHALKSVATRTGCAILATSYLIEVSLEGEAGEAPVSLSHADFGWQLLRWWCWSESEYPRDEANLSITDHRTGEHRLSLDVRLDETMRRFRVVSMRPTCTSLREARRCYPSGTVFHKLLARGEEPPPGAQRVIYHEGIDIHPEPSPQMWCSNSVEA